MKKILVTVVLSFLMSLNAAEAKTTFLPKAGNGIGTSNKVTTNSNNAARCHNLGYIYLSTSGCEELLEVCPYSAGYYRACCPHGHRYTIEQCQAMGKLPVASDIQTCDYYKCE